MGFLDPRSVQCFRYLLRLYLCYDLFQRWPIREFISDPPPDAFSQIWFQMLPFEILYGMTVVVVCVIYSSKTLLFLLIHMMHGRNEYANDGSDQLVRIFLLWDIFGMETDIAGIAVAIQIVFVYWGTVARRLLDQVDGTQAWSDGTAIHYALCGFFASRNGPLKDWIIANTSFVPYLTYFSLVSEIALPFLCLVGGRYRHYAAFTLALLHVGLWIMFRLPNWQLVAIMMQVLWIPGTVWTRWQPSSPPKSPVGISRAVQLFLFAYMVYNFAGHRKWIPQHDGGNIGEILKISQRWNMYGAVPPWSPVTIVSGVREMEGNETRFDVMNYLKTGEDREILSYDVIPFDSFDRFPSPRWERLFSKIIEQRPRMHKAATTLCSIANSKRRLEGKDEYSAIEVRGQSWFVAPFGKGVCFDEASVKAARDRISMVECRKLSDDTIEKKIDEL